MFATNRAIDLPQPIKVAQTLINTAALAAMTKGKAMKASMKVVKKKIVKSKKAAMKANGKVPADSWLSALPNKGEWPEVAKNDDGSLKPEGKLSKKETEEKY